MDDTLQLTADVLEVVIVPLLLIELLWLRRSGTLTWARVKEMLANISSLAFVVPAGIAGFVAGFALFEAISGVLPWSIPTNAGTAIVAVLIADLIYYLEHRFEHVHRLPWDMWHSVHHSSESYDQTTSLRLGFFDALLTMGFTLPMVLLGFSPNLTVLASGIVIGYQTWIHTEWIQKTPRWFEAIFNTASHHRAHHGADDHYLDVNYGGILIIWDRIFDTFQAEINRPTYGLTTQIESSNPIDVQFSQLRLLWKDLKADRSWRDRFRRLWNRPGWQPEPHQVCTRVRPSVHTASAVS
jgi:sterol desaturase/sphingolipid hydroxylase (fatty acid hydroxylase superfamily)